MDIKGIRTESSAKLPTHGKLSLRQTQTLGLSSKTATPISKLLKKILKSSISSCLFGNPDEVLFFLARKSVTLRFKLEIFIDST